MSDANHSKLPWSTKRPVAPRNADAQLDIGISGDVNGKKEIIAEVFGRVGRLSFAPANANADLIVKAVNCHGELLAACKLHVADAKSRLRNPGEEGSTIDDAYNACVAAIAKAEKTE